MPFLISIKPAVIGLSAGVVLITLATAFRIITRPAASDDSFSLGLLISPRPHFFTMPENAFYTKLSRIAQEHDLCVFPKVGLNDIFMNRPGADPGQLSRYARMRVDCLLVSRKDYRPVAGIELIGPTYQRDHQATQDGEKSAVFNAAWLPIIRFNHGAQAKEIREQLERTLGRTDVAARADRLRIAKLGGNGAGESGRPWG